MASSRFLSETWDDAFYHIGPFDGILLITLRKSACEVVFVASSRLCLDHDDQHLTQEWTRCSEKEDYRQNIHI